VADLLQQGANPNTCNHIGEPVLLEAADANNVNIVALLLAHRADPELQTPDKKTALDVAKSNEVRTLLQVYQGISVATSVWDLVIASLDCDVRQRLLR